MLTSVEARELRRWTPERWAVASAAVERELIRRGGVVHNAGSLGLYDDTRLKFDGWKIDFSDCDWTLQLFEVAEKAVRSLLYN